MRDTYKEFPITNYPTFDIPSLPLTRAERRKKERLLNKRENKKNGRTRI